MSEAYFISYSSLDGAESAEELARALAGAPSPIPVWLDKQNLRPGEDWDEQIGEAIRLTPALLFVVTGDSVGPFCMCKSEWAFALDNVTPVIPLRFDPQAALPFRLSSREYIDFVDSFTAGLERLRSHLAWMGTAAGRRREIRYQVEYFERRLAQAADSDRLAIQERVAELNAEFDALPPAETAIADALAPTDATAQSTPSELEESAEAGLHASRNGPPRRVPWTPPADRRDPVVVLEDEARGLESELVPVRYGRMLTSPFNFHRGTPAIMASDLASLPNSGIAVQVCGDAALLSFGFVAAAPTQLVFDIVSFDHTMAGPFEWDVKRLATSLVLAADDRGFSRSTATRVAEEAAKAYRSSIAKFAKLSPFEVLQQPIDAAAHLLPGGARKEPKRRDAWLARWFSEHSAHVTRGSDGKPYLVENPPFITHVDDAVLASEVRDAYDGYVRSLPDQAAAFLRRYELVDKALLVAGVERVGRGDVLMLLVDRENGEQLLLDLRRPSSSALAPNGDATPYSTEAERVVRGQRLLQAAADAYLGWSAFGDGGSRYVRRRRPVLAVDWLERGKKGKVLLNYGSACATALARGHARSGDAAAIARHVGDGPAFDDAIAMFAGSYAEQTRRDFAAFVSAVSAGRLDVESA